MGVTVTGTLLDELKETVYTWAVTFGESGNATQMDTGTNGNAIYLLGTYYSAEAVCDPNCPSGSSYVLLYTNGESTLCGLYGDRMATVQFTCGGTNTIIAAAEVCCVRL
jgi:hypothetical protein